MLVIVLALLVVLILFGLGFTLHVLWWVAVAALVIWLLGFLFHGGGTAVGRRRRWYNW